MCTICTYGEAIKVSVQQSRPLTKKKKKHQICAKYIVDVHGIDVANTDDNNQERILVGGGVIKRNIL